MVKGGVLATMLALFVMALFIFVLPFAFPTPPPIITRFQATTLFSPNGDGRRDVARVNVRVHEPSTVRLEIQRGGETIATLIDGRRLPRGWHTQTWDGTDDAGRRVADGMYAIKLRAESGSKRFNTTRSITVDTAPPAPAAFRVVSGTLAQPGPGECRATLTSHDAGSVLFEALRPGGTRVLAHRGPRPLPAGKPVRWRWGGRADDRRELAPGLHIIRATLSDAGRNTTVLERTCWVGRWSGAASPAAPAPRTQVEVTLRTLTGEAVDDAVPVTAEFRRRTGTPGRDMRPPLGARLGPRYRGPAGDIALTTPAGIRPDALWLSVRAQDGSAQALIELGAGR